MSALKRASESNVRYYSRIFPANFVWAENSILRDDHGTEYIDFLSGAGALNYGHNNPAIKHKIMEYLGENAPVHALDLETPARTQFLTALQDFILTPRNLNYKVQFPGPTGTNAVEAALKLARKVTGRLNVIAFSNAYHGMTLGALSVSANHRKRNASEALLRHVTRLPYDGQLDGAPDAEECLTMIAGQTDAERPAAIILETIQGEGGLSVAGDGWLRSIAKWADELGALLIIDDIQAGCGRTGSFFSFERSGIKPDIICMAKSISGFGLPLAVLLLSPDIDLWEPGEHNGTFRSNCLALVGGAAALEYWRDYEFTQQIRTRERITSNRLLELAAYLPNNVQKRGLGLLQGLSCATPEDASEVQRIAYANRLIVEICGAQSEVIKIMPPLTIEVSVLQEGLDRLALALRQHFGTVPVRAALPRRMKTPADGEMA